MSDSEDLTEVNYAENERQKTKVYGTQLLFALREKRFREACKLILDGADIHMKDTVGWTPLHYAALEGNVDLIKLLLLKGAKLVCQDTDGQIPLHKAASRGNIQAILLLVARGPKIFTLDKLGRFPLEMAVRNQETKAVELLLMFGSEIVLQDWSWTINTSLNEKEKAIVELMSEQQTLASGFKFGGIKYDLCEIQTNGSPTTVMEALGVSINTEDVEKEFYIYCCRMQIEFTDMKRYISDEEEEELFSDVYDVRTWNFNKRVITLTVTAQSLPRKNEKIGFISPGNIGKIDEVTKHEEEQKTEVIITLHLNPSGSTRFALTRVEKKEIVPISKEAVVIKPEAEPDAVIDIPKDTFSSGGELSLQISGRIFSKFPLQQLYTPPFWMLSKHDGRIEFAKTSDVKLVDTTEANEELEDVKYEENDISNTNETSEPKEEPPREEPTLLTSVLDISMSNGQQPKKDIPIKLPIHNANGEKEFVAITTDKIDSYDPGDWDVIPAKLDPSGKAAVFKISHFSFYAGASKKKVDEDAAQVIETVIKSVNKVRKIAFCVLTRAPRSFDVETDVIVACGSPRTLGVLKQMWIRKDYVEPTKSDETFEVPEGQAFKIFFTGGIKETNGLEAVPLYFKTNSQDNVRQFQICPIDVENEETRGGIAIKTEETYYPEVVVQVKAKGCLGGKMSKKETSEAPIQILEELTHIEVIARIQIKKPEEEATSGKEAKGINEKPEEEATSVKEAKGVNGEELEERDKSRIKTLNWSLLLDISTKLDAEETYCLGMQLHRGQAKLDALLVDTPGRGVGVSALTLLQKWRGQHPRHTEVEMLTRALMAINREDLANEIQRRCNVG